MRSAYRNRIEAFILVSISTFKLPVMGEFLKGAADSSKIKKCTVFFIFFSYMRLTGLLLN